MPNQLKHRGPVPKYVQLRGILLELIEGELKADDPIPSERELGERFAVARMTVRQAIDALVAEGRLYRVPARGTFVARPKLEVPLRVTSFTEDIRARGMEPGAVLLSARTEAAGADIAAALGLPGGAQVHVIERLRTADGRPMAIECARIVAARAPDLLDHDFVEESLYATLAHDYGLAIDGAEQEIEAAAAVPEMPRGSRSRPARRCCGSRAARSARAIRSSTFAPPTAAIASGSTPTWVHRVGGCHAWRVIDWNLAGQVARGIANIQPAGNGAPFRAAGGPAAESERLVSEYTGLVALHAGAGGRGGRPGGLDRRQPEVAGERARSGGRQGRGRHRAGALPGRRRARRRGGRDLGLPGRARPGPVRVPGARARQARADALRRAQPRPGGAALEAPNDQLLRWVALHETTHALQFGGVPWLRAHLAGMVRELLGALQMDPRSFLRMPDITDLRKLVDRVREDGLAVVAIGADRRDVLDRVQAFMAVLEGYAEHVMDAVGLTVLDDLPALRTALRRRRRDRSGLLKLLERLIGMDLKLRQYEQGKAFCDEVVIRAGIDGLNRVWAGPEYMPRWRSSTTPPAWLNRTERLGLREAS